MKRILVILLVIALPLVAAKTGAIKGTISDSITGNPISGASVKVNGTKLATATNAKGTFFLKSVPAGTQKMSVSANGYASLRSVKVKVRPGKTSRINLKMKPANKRDWKSATQHRVDEASPSKNSTPKKLKKEAKSTAPEKSGIASDRAVSLKKNSAPVLIEGVENAPNVEAEDEERESVERATPDSSPAASLAKPGSSGGERSGSVDEVETRPSTPKKSTPKDSGPRTEPKGAPKTGKKIKDLFFMWDAGDKPSAPVLEERTGRSAPRKSLGGLKAGFADDNQQFNYFLGFLEKYASQVDYYPYNISERIQIVFEDGGGRSLPNMDVQVRNSANQILDTGLSYADGSFFFYPAQVAEQDQTFQLNYFVGGRAISQRLERFGPRQVKVIVNQAQRRSAVVPVDIVFILDTTGSMGEEIRRLLETIDIIHMNLTSLPNLPEVRFGMVLYRDKDDSYVTKVIHPTSNIDKFRHALTLVEADGGGDTPEDLQSALKEGMESIRWNQDGLRLGFVITDATAHLDYHQNYTYIKAAEVAKRKGIKLFTVGTGGLDIRGEYILRQISQLTYAKYLFLTYGQERGENVGGRVGSVSHHTGSNYQTDKLEAIIIRIAKEEISLFTDNPVDLGEDYFQAASVDFESREETLSLLFHDAISRLIDYSSIRIENMPKLGVLPVSSKHIKAELSAEYFTEQIQLSVSTNRQFTLIARKDLQQILEEQELQLSGLLSDTETMQVGELLGAELLLSGELYEQAAGYDLFLKLLRVETAEILAVTKIVMDKDLGL